MGTYLRHVFYFSRKFHLQQFNLFPRNQNFDPSYFDPIRKFGMSTRGLTLIFDPVPSTYFRPSKSVFRFRSQVAGYFPEFRCYSRFYGFGYLQRFSGPETFLPFFRRNMMAVDVFDVFPDF